jgi:hypothetical protein
VVDVEYSVQCDVCNFRGEDLFYPDDGESMFLRNVYIYIYKGTAQWLRCCATNWKVAGSIPAEVIKFFQSHYGPEVDSSSNRTEYQEHFLGVKLACA